MIFSCFPNLRAKKFLFNQFFYILRIVCHKQKNIFTSSVLVESESQLWLDIISVLGTVYLVLMEQILHFWIDSGLRDSRYLSDIRPRISEKIQILSSIPRRLSRSQISLQKSRSIAILNSPGLVILESNIFPIR
jgi:hypothetical protein